MSPTAFQFGAQSAHSVVAAWIRSKSLTSTPLATKRGFPVGDGELDPVHRYIATGRFPALEPGRKVGEERRCRCAVDDAVIDRERERHDRGDHHRAVRATTRSRTRPTARIAASGDSRSR